MISKFVQVLTAAALITVSNVTPAQAANKKFVCSNSSWGRIEFSTAPSRAVKNGTYINVVIFDKSNKVNIAWLAAHTPSSKSSNAKENAYIESGINSRLNRNGKNRLFVSGCNLK
jgi:hypothetical protein